MKKIPKKLLHRMCYAIAAKRGFSNKLSGGFNQVATTTLQIMGEKIEERLRDKELCKKLTLLYREHVRLQKRLSRESGVPYDFYSSNGWRYLRRNILAFYGSACMKCGKVTLYPHIDHIKPRSKNPELELDASNMQVLCKGCNKTKSNTSETDYRKTIMDTEKCAHLTHTAKRINQPTI